MAKKQPKPGRPQKHAASAAPGRTGASLGIRIDPELRERANAYIADFKAKHGVKPSLTEVVEMALRELFDRAGAAPKSSATG